MFSITCDSCAAKLKVRNVSLIGQTLACPKCGEMVSVVAPEDFVPPPPSESSMVSASDVSDLSGMSDFDDIQSAIDQAVGKTSAPKIITGNKRKPASGPVPSTLPQGRAAVNSAFIAAETARRRAAASTDADRGANSADLSPKAMGDWSSPQARNRRRILIASLITIVLIAITVGLVLSFGGNRGGNPVAVKPNENPAENPANQNATVEDPNTDDPATTDPEANPENPPGDPPKNDDPQTSIPDLTNNTPPAIPPIEITQTPDSANQQPAPIPGLENPITDSNDTDPPALPESPIQKPTMPDDPLKRNFGAGIQSGLTPNEMQIPDALGELGSLLELQGTSVTAMENAAASSFPDTTAGVPAFFIARPDSVTINVADSMKIAAAKISYTGVPLTIVLNELSQLGGLPIAWDGRAILDAGIDPRTPVDVDIVGGTLADALNAAAKKAGAELMVYDWGLGLVPDGDKTTITKSISVSRSGTTDPNRMIGLAGEIPKLFAPGTWETPDSGYGITIDGDTLEITHNQRTVRQIEKATEQLNLLVSDSSLELPVHADIANATLDKKIELPMTIDMTIGDFLRRIETKQGITILVDWSMISGSGWNLTTVVPGNFAADDNRQLLNRLARAMDLHWYAVGPSTFMLTTPVAARATINVEVYPVAILLEGQITQENLMEVLRRSAGARLSSDIYTNVYFDGESRSFLVSAPPFVQEQVASVIGELKKAVQTKAAALPESPIGN